MSGDSLILRKTKHRWYLRVNALYKEAQPTIEWANVLPRGFGTKHQRAYLMLSFKQLIEAMISAPRDNRGQLSHSTILNWVFAIQRMVRWMISRGIWRFSALKKTDLQAYIDWCRDTDEKRRVSDHTFYYKLSILEQMWMLRKKYSGALKHSPVTLMPPQRRGFERKSWKAIDEPAALALIGDALSWINAHGDYLKRIAESLWSMDRRVAKTIQEKKLARGEFYRTLAKEPEFQQIAQNVAVQDKRNTTYLCLRRALTITDGACVLLCLFVVGLRIRELSSLDSGCLKTESLVTGEAVTRIHGIAAKKDGKCRTWISCDAVNKALNYVEEFYSNARRNSPTKALFVSRNTGALPSPGFKVYRTAPSILGGRMRAFSQSPHRAGAPAVGRLHPHAARKTFARFVVLRDKRALESLAYHFGHVHRAITDSGYVGHDIELATLLAEENRKDLAESLSDLLSSSNVGGKGGQMLADFRTKNVTKFRGKLGLQRLVNQLIEKGVQLAPCDWGYCIYSQSLSACLGDSNGPNPVRRSPDVCSTCSNFATTERHRAWWERRYEADERFLQQADLPTQTIEWVSRRLNNTSRVINVLNQPSLNGVFNEMEQEDE